MASAERIVDADGHVLEHPTAMLEYMPSRYRERCFHIETRADGSEWLHFEGRTTNANFLALAGTGGLSLEDRERARRGELKYSEVKPGAYKPGDRLAEMATDDIQQAVVYPTMFLGISGFADLDFAEAQADAYNRWLGDYCRHAPRQLFGIATLVQTDVERAIRGAKRAKEQGLVGVFLRPNPSVDGKHFCDPIYDPLWATLQDLDLTVGFHPYLANDLPGACRDLGFGVFVAPGARPMLQDVEEARASGMVGIQNIFFSQALSNVFDMQTTITMLTCGGVLERFPKLKVIFLEANGGWIVPWLERLDHHFEIFPWDVPQMKRPASEYFKRQCWISFDPDESTLRFTAESPLCGPERIIWASDYPHPDAKIPGVVGELREAMEGLPQEAQERILGLNAVDLYSLPTPS
ncbi:MAG: amidohydrolase [Deltaproteobacteria bacterium]|nr:amidohydrolase [Deltaproteobacteria bacterium]